MAFEGVSIDIIHNVLIVTDWSRKILLQKSLKFGESSELDVL